MQLRGITAVLAWVSTAAANVLHIPVARNTAAGVARRTHPGLSKRATVTESLINNSTSGGYYATVSVGTPGQDVTMILDTGSSDGWVASVDASLCKVPSQCGATFNASASSTYKTVVADGFTIRYADGSGADGDYFTDDFTIGDVTVRNLQMGIAKMTALGTGILGIGFALNEAAATSYSNLVSAMVNQSKIDIMAYSLYLNEYYSSTGEIIFGGVDTDKFIGNLATVPILPDARTGDYNSFTVGLTGLSIAFANGTTLNASLTALDNSLKSILDSGTTLSYLPNAIAKPIFEAVGVYEDELANIALVDCNIELEAFTFTVSQKATITVPRDELVQHNLLGLPFSKYVPFASPCLFGIQSMEDTSTVTGDPAHREDYALLGDTFLRSAYVVYDLENLQIGLAPANFHSTTTNVQELKAGAANLASFSGVASQAASSSSSSSSGTSTTSPTTAATGTSTISSSGTATAPTTVVTETSTASSSVTSTAPTPTVTRTNTTSSETSSSPTVESAAIMGQEPPNLQGLFSGIGISLAFAMSGTFLLWL